MKNSISILACATLLAAAAACPVLAQTTSEPQTPQQVQGTPAVPATQATQSAPTTNGGKDVTTAASAPKAGGVSAVSGSAIKASRSGSTVKPSHAVGVVATTADADEDKPAARRRYATPRRSAPARRIERAEVDRRSQQRETSRYNLGRFWPPVF
ncbi:MAG: hypothetical protein R3D67_04005 [Hyphomicrobiaceae bacterium]